MSTIAALLPSAAERHADRVALTTKRDGAWVDVRFSEVGSIVTEIALGLLDLGLAKGDRLAILCNTRPEWTYVDFAASTAGAVIVPIYPTSSPEECAWVLSDSDTKIVVCEDAEQLAKLTAIRDRLSALEQVVVIDAEGETADAVSLADIRARGGDEEALRERTASVAPEDVYTIIYTSGTTGRPKGCMLSHRNFWSILDAVGELGVIEQDDTTYMFLPLAHVFSLMIQLVSCRLGAKVAYFGGDPTKVIPELQEVKPTYFPSVPRIFEKIYAMAVPPIKAQLGEDRFDEMVALGVQVHDLEYSGQEVPDELRERWSAFDDRVFEPVRETFGGEIRQAVTGAAPIDHAVLEFFYAAAIPVMEGYGMTETATAITVCTPQHHKWGTVGRALPGLELRIADDGEILVKGPNVFEGYYKNEEATAETLVDGWLYTGDLGELDEEGYLTITGRKKDLIITAGGKNITPSNLENDVKQSPYVSQAVMHGDRRPFPSMLITLDPDEIAAWATEQQKPTDLVTLAEDPDVHALIQQMLDKANANYAHAAQVKKFFILDHDLSQESGELTPTMKVKRNVVNERYAPQFDALYASEAREPASTR
jgi:long-chain acyl-CoA synthetase